MLPAHTAVFWQVKLALEVGDLGIIGLPPRHLNVRLVDGRAIQAPSHAIVLLAVVPVKCICSGRIFRVHRRLGRVGEDALEVARSLRLGTEGLSEGNSQHPRQRG